MQSVLGMGREVPNPFGERKILTCPKKVIPLADKGARLLESAVVCTEHLLAALLLRIE